MSLATRKPLTTNLLLSHDRARVLHSARKLGAMMGTTPVLLDPSPHTSLASLEIFVPPLAERSSRTSHRSTRREGVIFTPRSSSSSLASLEEKFVPDLEPGPPLPPVAKLALSPESRNSLHAATRLRLVLTLTQPAAPSAGPYNNPYSHNSSPSTDSLDANALRSSLSILLSAPAPAAPGAEHAARRRKMVKLVHMLGGPIPHAVVFPPPRPSPPPNSTSKAQRRRSRSVPPRTSTTTYSTSTSASAAAEAGPRKLVRPHHIVLPTLSVDLISHPRPLAAYRPLRSSSSSPTSHGTGTVSSAASRGRGREQGRGRDRRPITPTPAYSLRRRGTGRESTQGSE
ncbi:hypothetical protein DFH08DRAFT_906388 [Mycena albidolilacea]|uniref:Uncharacterized protein n=1 Tax=Mycena albidolilacea TaxID=1033008 RepID=A0AAD7E854_9AGAR|nr:hypothetical protein DFH08DRAFT_906388 [Mycena albidolilacea]